MLGDMKGGMLREMKVRGRADGRLGELEERREVGKGEVRKKGREKMQRSEKRKLGKIKEGERES